MEIKYCFIFLVCIFVLINLCISMDNSDHNNQAKRFTAIIFTDSLFKNINKIIMENNFKLEQKSVLLLERESSISFEWNDIIFRNGSPISFKSNILFDYLVNYIKENINSHDSKNPKIVAFILYNFLLEYLDRI